MDESNVSRDGEKVVASYDATTGRIKLDNNGQSVQKDGTVLRACEFFTEKGERVGCAGTGVLGFVRGENPQPNRIDDASAYAKCINEGVPVDFNGYDFYTNTKGPLKRADYVMIVGSKMLALNAS